jgi:hypothetical protein
MSKYLSLLESLNDEDFLKFSKHFIKRGENESRRELELRLITRIGSHNVERIIPSFIPNATKLRVEDLEKPKI